MDIFNLQSVKNNSVLFHVLFLQIWAHNPLPSSEQNTVKTNFCDHTHTQHTHTHTHRVSRIAWKGEISKVIRMCVWWSNLARNTVPDRQCRIKKDLWPSECMRTKGRRRIVYQKKSVVAGGLICKLSGVQSSRQERSSCGTEKWVFLKDSISSFVRLSWTNKHWHGKAHAFSVSAHACRFSNLWFMEWYKKTEVHNSDQSM